MKNLLISLAIVAVLTVTAWQVMVRGGDEPAQSDLEANAPGQRFLRSCREVSADQRDPTAYCNCLWSKGVTSATGILTSERGRAAAAACSTAPTRPTTHPEL